MSNQYNLPVLEFEKNWENKDQFPTYETSETQVRKDLQCLHDETKAYINDQLLPAIGQQLEEKATKQALEDLTRGQIPDNSITEQQLAPAVTNKIDAAATKTELSEGLGNRYVKTDVLSAVSRSNLGIAADATPAAAFDVLSPYNRHQWFKKVVEKYEVGTESGTVKVMLTDKSSQIGSNTIHWYSSLSLDPANRIVVPSKSSGSVTISHSDYMNIKDLGGKYISVGGVAYYVPVNPHIARDAGGSGYRTYVDAQRAIAVDKSAAGPDTYLYSADANAYPKSGEADGYAFTYMGRALQHVLHEPLRVATGRYYGTGAYGPSNPNRLEFPFKKVLACFVIKETTFDSSYLCYLGQPGSVSDVFFTAGDNYLEWYYGGTTSPELRQRNENNVYYYYFAVGIDTDRKEA